MYALLSSGLKDSPASAITSIETKYPKSLDGKRSATPRKFWMELCCSENVAVIVGSRVSGWILSTGRLNICELAPVWPSGISSN